MLLRRAGFCLAFLLVLSMPAAAVGAPDPLRSHQWNLDMVGADKAHTVTRGAGAVVAVVDTGVSLNHPDLAGRLVPGYDFVAGNAEPQDQNGHGTNVAGIIAADADNGIGVDSVAPEAAIMPVRVLDANGAGDITTVVKGVDFAATHGADVINLSLGGNVADSLVGEQELAAAVDRALARGIVVVAAAGNDSVPICEQPVTQGRLLCVAAVDRRGLHSYFSSFGYGLGISAPGGSTAPAPDEDILSTFFDPATGQNTYASEAGTSQATPHVSAVAALLVSRGIRGQAAVQRIIDTATPAGTGPGDPLYGAGIVNAAQAVAGLTPGPDASVPPTAATKRPRARRTHRARRRRHSARRHARKRAHRR